MAAATMQTVGSADFTAAARSAVNVAMPQRRGTEDATKAIRMTPFPNWALVWRDAGRPCWAPWEVDRVEGVPVVSVPLAMALDRQPCIPPSIESTPKIRCRDPVPFEDARREARAHTTRAVDNERLRAWHLVQPLLELLLKDVPRAGHVTIVVLGPFANIDEESSALGETAGGPRIDLLRRRGGIVRRRDRLRVSAHVIEADERELRPQAIRLLLVAREQH